MFDRGYLVNAGQWELDCGARYYEKAAVNVNILLCTSYGSSWISATLDEETVYLRNADTFPSGPASKIVTRQDIYFGKSRKK